MNFSWYIGMRCISLNCVMPGTKRWRDDIFVVQLAREQRQLPAAAACHSCYHASSCSAALLPATAAGWGQPGGGVAWGQSPPHLGGAGWPPGKGGGGRGWGRGHSEHGESTPSSSLQSDKAGDLQVIFFIQLQSLNSLFWEIKGNFLYSYFILPENWHFDLEKIRSL